MRKLIFTSIALFASIGACFASDKYSESNRLARVRGNRSDVVVFKLAKTSFHEYAEELGRQTGFAVNIDRPTLQKYGLTPNEIIKMPVGRAMSFEEALNIMVDKFAHNRVEKVRWKVINPGNIIIHGK